MSNYLNLLFPVVGYYTEASSSRSVATTPITTQSHLLGLLQLLSLCYIIGTSIWMNFINGVRLRKAISKVAFFDVQKVLFPVYFANIQKVLFILILLHIHKLFPSFFFTILPTSSQKLYQSFFNNTYQAELLSLSQSAQTFGYDLLLSISQDASIHHIQLAVLITAWIFTFINSAILTPLTTRSLMVRYDLEKKAGIELGSTVPVNNPAVMSARKKFGMIHGISMLLSLFALILMLGYAVYATNKKLN